jgi:hypothetical protein
MSFKATIYGQEGTFRLVVKEYQNGNTWVGITEDGAPYATVSVNLPESDLLPPGEFYMKEWSENAPITEILKKLELVQGTNRVPAESGFVTDIKSYIITQKGIETTK